MEFNPKAGRFMAMEPVSMNGSPADIRRYWTPERRAAAINEIILDEKIEEEHTDGPIDAEVPLTV